jgi:DNA ligase-1
MASGRAGASNSCHAKAIGISPPDWFTGSLPVGPLDGELWIGRKKSQRTVSTVRRQYATDLWREVRFVIFDAPGEGRGFEARLKLVEMIVDINRPSCAVAHPFIVCTGKVRHSLKI